MSKEYHPLLAVYQALLNHQYPDDVIASITGLATQKFAMDT
jgi:hypothetical protein